ncbi:MAG: hypothetical protein F4Y30_03845 [Chloroflexi bacterium]|nr:hypothetical protein [Chloroflexota bacterium]
MTTQPRIDSAWRWLVGLFSEVLNPLLIIWLALFVCLGYILTLLMPVRIEQWTALLGATLLISLAGLSLRFWHLWRAGAYRSLAFEWRALLPMVPLLVFLPMMLAQLSSPSHQLQSHADLYISYVHELLYRETPAESVYIAGYPANFYWLYHALLAALAQLTALAPSQIAQVLNVLAVCSSFYWLSEVIVRLGLAQRRTMRLGCLVMLVYCAVNLTGALTLIGALLEDGEIPSGVRSMLLPGADRRLHSVLTKVTEPSTSALGILCFITALHICLRFMQGKLDRLGLVLLSACVALSLAVRQSATLYIGLVLFGGVGLSAMILTFDKRPGTRSLGLVALSGGVALCIFLRTYLVLYAGLALAIILSVICLVVVRDKRARQLAASLTLATAWPWQPRFLALWLVGSAGLTLPLLHYFSQFTSVNQVGVTINTYSVYNNQMLFTALLLLLPLFLVQTLNARRSQSWSLYAIQVSGWLALLITSLLILPNDDQHKAVFYVSILITVSALLALQTLEVYASGLVSIAARWLLMCFVALAFAKVIFVTHNINLVAAGWRFAYDGSHIVFLDGPIGGERMPAYDWIRQQSPVDAVLALPLSVHYMEQVMHERRSYARPKGFWFTDNLADYPARVAHVTQLYDKEISVQAYQNLVLDMQAQLPGRSLYAVILESEVPPAIMMARRAQQVFADAGGAHVYLLNPEAAKA